MKNDAENGSAKLHTIDNPELGYKAFISVNTLKGGMAFGGCRFSPNVTAEEVSELAYCMSLKLAPHGLPVGGAKGGFAVSPQNPNMLKIAADFGVKMGALLKSNVVLGKDLGATDEIMDHIYLSAGFPQLSPVHAHHPGKIIPNRIRDLTGYQKNMTGKGVSWAASAFFKEKIAKQTVIIQGSGAVGVGTAIRLMDMGATVIGISDKDHAVYNKAGLPREFFTTTIQGGKIDPKNLPKQSELLQSEQLYGLSANILILAAASRSVVDTHAAQVSAELVVEGSNFGLVESARTLLFNRGIMVIPDVIASSSSAAMVAYQMSSGNSITDEDLWSRIQKSILQAASQTVEVSRIEKIEPRRAYVDILVPRFLKGETTIRR
ncbi:MAG: Glu/Leu/Phe/Val dehydrogenase dimerization domain-containing protein [Bdellovibrionales bacterium]|nr:Glu/Leu/Phe/Val dehydrogenase dimerization domain-containing protein [Bdellovibrionales bacterium]